MTRFMSTRGTMARTATQSGFCSGETVGDSLLYQQIVAFADLLRRAVWKIALLLGDEFLNAAT